MTTATAISEVRCPGTLRNGRPCRRLLFRCTSRHQESGVYLELVCPKCDNTIVLRPGETEPAIAGEGRR